MKKKVLISIILLITVIPLFISNTSNAVDDSIWEQPNNDAEEQFNSMMDSGQATVDSDEGQSLDVFLNPSDAQNSAIANTLASIVSIIPFTVNKLLALVALDNETILEEDGTESSIFTIEGLLTNQYPLFDINLFQDVEQGPHAELSNNIKEVAAIWYTAVRNLSVIACAIILIYVGIRMAISTTAEESAKYKKMLTGWFIGVVLLFFMHYIVIIMMTLSEMIVNFIGQAVAEDTNVISMETVVLNDVFQNIFNADGWGKLYYVVLYCVLTFYELKFFVIYLFRVFNIFIMVVISPLISITYPIDTLGDGKAQAFNNWLKRLIMEIFIQPIHLLIYILFIYSAGEIAKDVPLLAIIFIIALDNGEKIIRSALKMSGKGLKDIKIGKGK